MSLDKFDKSAMFSKSNNLNMNMPVETEMNKIEFVGQRSDFMYCYKIFPMNFTYESYGCGLWVIAISFV